jgi:hypothetical protein
MPKLTKCIYGVENDPKKTPFGLINNQIRHNSIINNAGWFNINGEVLGRGDLSLQDFQNISKSLPLGEIFIALTEADSTFDMPSNLDRLSPGKDYVFNKAVWLVGTAETGKNVIMRVRDSSQVKTEVIETDGVKYVRVPKTEFLKTIKTPVKSAPKKEDKSKEDKADELITELKKQTKTIKAIPTAAPSTKPINKVVSNTGSKRKPNLFKKIKKV